MPSPVITQHFISGEFRSTSGSGAIDSVNPSNPSKVVATVPVADLGTVREAVDDASIAFNGWRALTGAARAEHLYSWAERINARAAELAEAIAKEVGKPIGEAKGEIGRCVAILRYYAGEAVRPVGDVIPALASGPLQYSQRVPLGVVGLITPWNFPFAIPLWKAAPALSVGNTVVLKPSVMSALCAQLLAEASIGLPTGVFNVIHGDGSTGKALVTCPGIKAVSFTGSAEVGSSIQIACAAANIKCQCEMGGKNAAVVLPDADMAQAAGLVAGGAIRFAGQKCTATSRVVIVESVWDDFLAVLKSSVDSLKVGSVLDMATATGPVINEASQKKLLEAIETQSDSIIYKSEATGDGYYVPPTIVGPVDNTNWIAQRELFGPVLVAIKATDFDHAVEIVNESQFGLSTAIYTKNIAMALAYADRVEAGLVRINGDTTGVDPHAPFGGTKGSSSGTREQGEVAKDFYTEWKTIQINP